LDRKGEGSKNRKQREKTIYPSQQEEGGERSNPSTFRIKKGEKLELGKKGFQIEGLRKA